MGVPSNKLQAEAVQGADIGSVEHEQLVFDVFSDRWVPFRAL
jgi:hypothetical protein